MTYQCVMILLWMREGGSFRRTLLTTPCGLEKNTFTAKGNLTHDPTVKNTSVFTSQQKKKRAKKITESFFFIAYLF